MKVYVMLEAKPLCPQTYIGVAKTWKDAEKRFRDTYPYMRRSEDKGDERTYVNMKYDIHNPDPNLRILFIKEEEL